MEPKEIIIHKYRGISNDVRIPLHNGVYPILGINESGKTSILQGISAFDYRNDKLHPEHIKNIRNRFKASNQREGIISCIVKTDANNLKNYLGRTKNEITSDTTNKEYYFQITRKINGNCSYTVDFYTTDDEKISGVKIDQQFFSEQIIENFPTILYFTDFGDSLKDKFTYTRKITNDEATYYSSSLQDFNSFRVLAEILAKRKNDNFYATNLFDINEYDDAELSTFQSALNEELNNLTTDYWRELHGKKVSNTNYEVNLEIKREEQKTSTVDSDTIKEQNIFFNFRVKDENVFFPINQRSKGFMWFFSFVYRTQLNLNKLHQTQIIYLLDEPGCYLHSMGQKGLCEILKQLGRENSVIYNTHSHYLLDYSFLPNTKLVYKEKKKILIHNFGKKRKKNQRLDDAFQPIYDCLKVESSFLSSIADKYRNILILEGITDFYIFDKFLSETNREIGFIPSTGARNIPIQIASFLPFKNVKGLLDGDAEGQEVIEEHSQYEEFFITYGENKKLENYLDDKEWEQYAKSKNKKNASIKDLIKLLYKDENYDIKLFARTIKNINDFWRKCVSKSFK